MNQIVICLGFTLTILHYSGALGIEPDRNALSFYFYSNENPSHRIKLNITDQQELAKTSFSPDQDSFFIIHGWKDTVNSNTVLSIKDALLREGDANIILVGWDGIADELYPLTLSKIERLGNTLGDLIDDFVNIGKLDLDITTFIGHSIGAHIAGVAGDRLDGRIEIIVGLDPAGIGFTWDKTRAKLGISSAEFVQVIHTGAHGLGYFEPLGDADYYPNGGKSQPMCGMFDLNCSHLLVIQYYVESIRSGGFHATKCENYNIYTEGGCTGNEISPMGGYETDISASGMYFLDTNLLPPYSKD